MILSLFFFALSIGAAIIASIFIRYGKMSEKWNKTTEVDIYYCPQNPNYSVVEKGVCKENYMAYVASGFLFIVGITNLFFQ